MDCSVIYPSYGMKPRIHKQGRIWYFEFNVGPYENAALGNPTFEGAVGCFEKMRKEGAEALIGMGKAFL